MSAKSDVNENYSAYLICYADSRSVGANYDITMETNYSKTLKEIYNTAILFNLISIRRNSTPISLKKDTVDLISSELREYVNYNPEFKLNKLLGDSNHLILKINHFTASFFNYDEFVLIVTPN